MDGRYNSVARTIQDGMGGDIAIDVNGRVIFTGAGTAQSPVGGTVSVQSPGRRTTTCTIASGQSLSGANNLGAAGTLVGILIPSAWTAAGLSFAVSVDGVNFFALYNPFGQEYTIPSASVAANQFIQLPFSDFMGFQWVEIRSGTAGSPVTQGGDRTLTLVYTS